MEHTPINDLAWIKQAAESSERRAAQKEQKLVTGYFFIFALVSVAYWLNALVGAN
jgi:hypothetical protein